MKRSILIVHPDPEVVLMIREILDDFARAERFDLVIRRAKTQSESEQIASTWPVDLLITALAIARDEHTIEPAGTESRNGIELIRNLRQEKPGMGAVLISTRIDSETSNFTKLKHVGLVEAGPEFSKLLTIELKPQLGQKSAEPPKRVNLEIVLTNKGSGDNAICTYQFQYEGRDPEPAEVLTVESEKLDTLVKRSRSVNKWIGDSDWESTLREIGGDLCDLLFSDRTPSNKKFQRDFDKWNATVKGLDRMRIRFVAGNSLQPIALEALKDRDHQYYWEVRAPIYRRLPNVENLPSIEPRGLFQDDDTAAGEINILIIHAAVPPGCLVIDKLLKLDLTLDYLPEAAQEVADLEAFLSRTKREGGRIGEIRVVDQTSLPAGRTFRQELEHLLTTQTWHIVHYVGHTHYDDTRDGARGKGFIFLPNAGAVTQVEPVVIGRFAEWLGQTRFVFLSSCRSAEQAFIFHLANAGVPAVLGFLWKVNDAMVREFTVSFYRHLFAGKERSLEYACFHAKKEMYHAHEDDPIWASPVLMMHASAEMVPSS